MKPENEPGLAPSSNSVGEERRKAFLGRGLGLVLIGFALMMFIIYGAILLMTGAHA